MIVFSLRLTVMRNVSKHRAFSEILKDILLKSQRKIAMCFQNGQSSPTKFRKKIEIELLTWE